jgi:cysteine desulfurase
MAIYFDHNATTPVDERVLDAMLPYFHHRFGNPSSRHSFGRVARAALDQAREQVAALAGATPGQVIFTSGGSESNQLALQGAARAMSTPGRVARSAIEHPSVLAGADSLRGFGWQVDSVPVDAGGRVIGLDAVIGDDTRLVSVMLANNETGVVQDLGAVVEAAARVGGVVHTDAVQAAGKMVLDFSGSGVQLMTLSAHKLYGPKGAAAVIRDRALDLRAVLPGGGQEGGLRSGTENLPAIVGFGRAAELALAELPERRALVQTLRDDLQQGLLALPGVTVFAADQERLPNTLMFAVDGIDGETLLMELDRKGLAVASGSACSSDGGAPSHVLTAMGVPAGLARGALRVSLGKDNSAADIQQLLKVLGGMTALLKKMARAS